MRNALARAGRLIRGAGLLGLIALAGCRSGEIGGPISSQTTAEGVATPLPLGNTTPEAILSPVVIIGPSPAAANNTIPAPPSPTSVQTSTPGALAEPISGAATETVTATPPPTFTPPPPPPPLEGEQLWLQRPVPSSGPAWTDKAYPYGSTRGGSLRPHTGVEFIVQTGTPILAAASGTVLVAGDDSLIAHGPQTNFYGNLVIIEHDSSGGASIFTLYGHLSEINVTAGQRVSAGEVVGLSGESGVADGPHLHFEVRAGINDYGSTRNPLLWLAPLPQTAVVAGRIVGPGGELLYEAPIALIRADATAPYTATTSYALGESNSDSVLRENFVVDDVVPGFYQVVVDTGSRRFTTDLWVYPNRVNWVELVVGP